ncbi:MAG: glycosyltransferase family 39 protein [Acidobacteria bacterium]|nr:glycosyltransferase family 39 protein [Acidobacteriota bacterium]
MGHSKRNTERVWNIKPWIFYGLPLVLLAMFAGKPYHIDDALFLRMGDLLPWTLVGESSGKVEFLGMTYEALSPYESTHPPLIPYFLKLLKPLAQIGPVDFYGYHFGFLIFPALSLFFARRYLRAKRVGPHWSLFLVSSPIFFVNATNLMTDIAMTGMWLGAVVFASRYAENSDNRNAYVAGLLVFLALLTSYQSIALFPLIGAYFLIHKVPMKGAIPVLLYPLLGFLLFLLAVYLASGYMPFLASSIDYNIASEVKSGMALSHYLHKFIGVLINLGLGLALPTIILLMSVNQRRLIEHIVFSSVLTFTLFHLGKRNGLFDTYTAVETLWLRVLLIIGLIWSFQVVAKTVDGMRILIRDRRRAARMLLPCFWFLGVLAYNVIFMPYATARYILPAVPPALMLLFGHQLYRLAKAREGVLIGLNFVLALFFARVDYQQATADYELSQYLRNRVPDMSRLWFSDDSGLNRYLNQAGAHYLDQAQQDVPIGDYILITRGMIHPNVQASLSFVETWAYPSFAGMTLFDTQKQAGFYRSLDGLLPIAPAETVRRADLYQVNYFLKKLPEAEKWELSNPNYVGQTTFRTPDGNAHSVLYMHPDASIAFPVALDKPTRVSGRAMTDPSSWSKEGDGVSFSMGYRDKSDVVILWSSDLDGKKNVEDRAGLRFSVQVPANADAIWFAVGPGPAGDYRYDTAGWADLVFMSTEP